MRDTAHSSKKTFIVSIRLPVCYKGKITPEELKDLALKRLRQEDFYDLLPDNFGE